MRQVHNQQISFGSIDIREIEINMRSRSQIDKIAFALKYIYSTPEIRDEVFNVLTHAMPSDVSKKTGRPGMDMWQVLVLAVYRYICDWDYDELCNMANQHLLIRQFLGHPRDVWQGRKQYSLQTIKDNVSRLTPELIDQISEIVVKAGYKLRGKKKSQEALNCSVDSFVVETNVHYPTDISLLNDALRTAIHLTRDLSDELGLKGWRQWQHHINNIKKDVRLAQTSKKSRDEEKKKNAHLKCILRANSIIGKIESTIETASGVCPTSNFGFAKRNAIIEEISKRIAQAKHQADLIRRRVLQGEIIPHCEKIHSIYEDYTRWISKGKAGVPVEFGLPVAIIKDQYGNILTHEVMASGSDVNVAVQLLERAKAMFLLIISCSFDKGFWSPRNREKLGEIIEKVIMPKKGRPNREQAAEQKSEEFKKLRKQHSAVESLINSLDHTGLDRCFDRGIHGFRRCVSLGILARNLHTLGVNLQQKEEKKTRRKRKAPA